MASATLVLSGQKAAGMDKMRWLFESMVVFFGTLMAAALVALGAPAGADLALVDAVRHGSESNWLTEQVSALVQTVWSAFAGAAATR